MAEKKAEKKSFLGNVKNFFNRIARYCKDTASELKKVVWPSKKQTQNNTIVVLVVVVLAALFMIVLDLLFHGIFQLVVGA